MSQKSIGYRKILGCIVAGIICVEYENHGKNQKYIAISDRNIYEIRFFGDEIAFHIPGGKDGNGMFEQTLFWPENCFDKPVDVQSVNLLADKKGTIYAITAGVKDNHINMLQLYQMEIQNKDSSGRILSARMKYIKDKEMRLCSNWLTFSAGTGIDIDGESILVYVTSKPATSSPKMSIGRSLM